MTATIPSPPDSSDARVPDPHSTTRSQGQDADPTEPDGNTAAKLTSQLIDAAVIGGLGLFGLFGFSAAYGGSRYLVTGAVGLLIGIAVALVGARRSWGVGAVGLATIAAFLLFGSAVALRQPELGGLVPTPANVMDLLDGATQGWARLSTTYPPVGSRLNLLVVPYLCGMLCTVIGVSVAVRSRRPMWAVLSPATVLVLSILFGTAQPASIVLQGAVFAVVLIGWWSYDYRDRRRVDVGGSDSRRWPAVIATLAAAGLISVLLGELGLIPGMGARPRIVLRDLTEPPFDPADYPSPLNGYRRFTNGDLLPGEPESEQSAAAGWRSTELMAVRGLPPQQRLRLASLDSYDGTVYRVTTGAKGSGRFEPVGQTLPPAPRRRLDPDLQRGSDDAEVSIEMLEGSGDSGAYEDIWVPLPEGASSLLITSDDEVRSVTLSEGVQYNAVTGTAALPQRLSPGDRLKVQAQLPRLPDEKLLKAWRQAAVGKGSEARVTELEQVTASSRTFAAGTLCTPPASSEAAAFGSASSPYELAERIAAQLIDCGAFSDGDSTQVRVNPGHNAWRLNRMLSQDGQQSELFGNGEQYAALAALIADSVGVPARVVMGFRSQAETDKWREVKGVEPRSDPEGTYVVTGADVTAWIEVDLEGAGWVPVYNVIPEKEVPEQRPQPQAPKPENVPPPPPPSIPPGEESEANTSRFNEESKDAEDGFQIPGWVFKAAGAALAPVAVIGGFTALIAGLKSRRRSRRRESGSPDVRIAGGWDEVKDLAADLGEPVPVRMTRSEEAAFIGTDPVRRLARHADGLVFGPASVDRLPVKQYWDEVDAARSSMVAGLSRFTRWKALVNLASLRRPSRGRPTAAVGRQSVSAGAVRSRISALPGASASKASP